MIVLANAEIISTQIGLDELFHLQEGENRDRNDKISSAMQQAIGGMSAAKTSALFHNKNW